MGKSSGRVTVYSYSNSPLILVYRQGPLLLRLDPLASHQLPRLLQAPSTTHQAPLRYFPSSCRMFHLSMNPVNLYSATQALILLSVNASLDNQRLEMLGGASLTLRRTLRVFNCLTSSRIKTTASSHLCARTARRYFWDWLSRAGNPALCFRCERGWVCGVDGARKSGPNARTNICAALEDITTFSKD